MSADKDEQTYTVLFRDSEQISPDDFRTFTRTIKVTNSTTIGEIRRWVKDYKEKFMHVEISENEQP